MLRDIGKIHGGVAVLPSPLVYLADLAKYWKDQNDDSLASKFASAMMVDNPAFDLTSSWLHNCLHDLTKRYRGSVALIALLKMCGKDLPTRLTMDNDFRKYVEGLEEVDYNLRCKIQDICHDERRLGSWQTLRSSGTHVESRVEPYNYHLGRILSGAIEMGDIERVCDLLGRGVNPNTELEFPGFAIQKASFRGSSEIARTLINMGAYVNAQGGRHGNALQAASAGGHDEIVQILLENGADVNAEGGEYGSALQAASHRGHDKIVQMLLDTGADVNAQGGEYGNALQTASAEGYHKIVQMLLDRGADVNAQGGHYGNALQAASEGGHDKIV
ncbi:hypothetical protein KCU67_g211, partial [Aureobasidium melanogenum]